MRKIVYFLFLVLFLQSCTKERQTDVDKLPDDIKCCCPPTVFLQPCNNFTQEESKALITKIKNVIKESAGIELDFEVLPTIQLSDSLLNDNHTRYRADKIIRSIEDNHHDAIIVLTHQDISCPYKGRKDWGVLGLSYLGKNVCIASDFRLRNKKRDYWKVAAHEFFHSYCSLSHCEKDIPTCIMKDAKGHADFSNKNHLCENCKDKCNI